MASTLEGLANGWPMSKQAKSQVRESDKPKHIAEIRFGMFRPEEMQKLAMVEVVNREIYQPATRNPVPYGVLDRSMGTANKTDNCGTCGQGLAECVGHFGVITLQLPVFHVGYFKSILTVLQCVCKSCARILLAPSDMAAFLGRYRMESVDSLTRDNMFLAIVARCKRTTRCPHCRDFVGSVKKAGALKLVHELYREGKSKAQTETTRQFHKSIEPLLNRNEELRGPLRSKIQNTLNPIQVVELFRRIPAADVLLLNMQPSIGRPEDMILTKLVVPPVCIRPSVTMLMSAGLAEDDLTIKLGDIIHINHVIAETLAKGQAISTLRAHWDYLTIQVAGYINGDLPGVPQAVKSTVKFKAYSGVAQRLKGKTGRFRGNLSGKRVDFSSRTVISPDANVAIDEVVIPRHLARILTVPERVCEANLARLRASVARGPDEENGASFVTSADGVKRLLKFVRTADVAAELAVGDTVDRHLHNGDVVLFNRQPSLHKVSIMCHRVRVHPWRTFRFNPCACTPYNADFDGDEMNVHVPQTEEARAEAMTLMTVNENLLTPRCGDPIVAAIQDYITAAFLVSHRDSFFDRAEFVQMCGYFSDATERIVLPPPALVKPMELWTGKQLFSVMLRGREGKPLVISLEAKTKSYTAGGDMCPSDGWCVFRRSELLCGVIDKNIIGSSGKSSLFSVIMRATSPVDATHCMSRLAKFCARWFATFGFSIGISDVWPSAKLEAQKNGLIAAANVTCDRLVNELREGTIEIQAGCSPDQSLENLVTKSLSDVRQECGNMCLRELKPTNAPLIMAMSGSKGSTINISQMVACVGQQTVSGKRIPDGFDARTLPVFEKGSRHPDAKGFCANSFFSGLRPTEFFFHTMGGREGLVDTAVKTADTGYMQRRLMKALEDLCVAYDGTVRNSIGAVVQFRYGDDKLDPCMMEDEVSPIDYPRAILRVRTENAYPDEPSLMPWQIREAAERFCGNLHVADLQGDGLLTIVGTRAGSPQREAAISRLYNESTVEVTERYRERVQAALENYAKAMARSRAALGLQPLLYGAAEPGEMSIANVEAVEATAAAMWRLTRSQLKNFLDLCAYKYERAKIEPGTAVGALSGQSIGEPGTQMTLKTFHFAGVASMNVTLGVPRIREIINASKSIATPVITAPLRENTETFARIVSAKVERTTLGSVVSYADVSFRDRAMHVTIQMNRQQIQNLMLPISPRSAAEAIRAAGIKCRVLHDAASWQLDVAAKPTEGKKLTKAEMRDPFFLAYSLREQVLGVVVSGIPDVSRAVISAEDGKYQLIVEGNGFRSLLGIPGVAWDQAKTNHVADAQSTLGIEAARQTIIDQISFTMRSHGMTVDARHLMLLADLMCFRGDVLGITRFGIGKMRSSTLMLASFEKTTDILFDAAVHHKRDPVIGVSERIIMGIPMSVGTGLFKVLYDFGAGSRALAALGRDPATLRDRQAKSEALRAARAADPNHGKSWREAEPDAKRQRTLE